MTVVPLVSAQVPQALQPLERLELLCDHGSLRVIRSSVTSMRMGDRGRRGDGVVGAAGNVGGRPVFCYAQDVAVSGGSLGEAHAGTIVRLLRLAGEARAPVIGFIESGGARLQEGIAALGGYARIFSAHVSLSHEVPQISIITGTSAGGGSYAPALTDFVVMTDAAAMFLTGPAIVSQVLGEDVTTAELGGPRVHERNGVVQLTARDDAEAVALARQLLTYLPQSTADRPSVATAVRPEREDVGPGPVVPSDPRKVYDMRTVVARIADAGSLLEISPRWARNMVCGFARLDGRAIGIVANQPAYLGGVIDSDAAQKAARFVATCSRFGLPLVVLVDTPGFLPGSQQERAGVIRHGASLLRAFADAAVPRLTVVLRKAFGGAYITMNSKDLGAHLVFAWPDAQIGIMGAEAAVGIINRCDLLAAADPAGTRRDLAAEYAREHLAADAAAQGGYIDEVIAPSETRERLCWALGSLASQRRRREDRVAFRGSSTASLIEQGPR